MASNDTRDNFNSQRIMHQDDSTASRLERTNGLGGSFGPYTPSSFAALNQDDSPTPAQHYGPRVQSLRNQSAFPTPQPAHERWPVPTPPSIGDNSSPWVHLESIPPLTYNGGSRSSTSAPNSNSTFGNYRTSTSRFIQHGVIITPSSSGNLTPSSGHQYRPRPANSTLNSAARSIDRDAVTVRNPSIGSGQLSANSTAAHRPRLQSRPAESTAHGADGSSNRDAVICRNLSHGLGQLSIGSRPTPGPGSRPGSAKSTRDVIVESSASDSDSYSDSDTSREPIIMGNPSSVRLNASASTDARNPPPLRCLPFRDPMSAPLGPRGVVVGGFVSRLNQLSHRDPRDPACHYSSSDEEETTPERLAAAARLERQRAAERAATADSQPYGYPHRPARTQHPRQYGPPTNEASSASIVPRPLQGFRPTWAAMRAKGPQAKDNNKERAALKAMYGISPNYAGDPTIERNRSADIPDSANCALWITFLPPDVTHHEILAEIRNMGRIWSVVISGPEPAKNHLTAAAKVVFFELAAAQKFYAMSCNPARRFKVRNHVTKVELNRIKTAQDNRRTNSRVLRIKGRPDVVNPDALTEYFKQKITFEVDEVITIVMNEDMGDVEYRFGSFGNQAELAYLALQREFDVGGIHSPYWEVQYGHDPCAPLPSAYN